MTPNNGKAKVSHQLRIQAGLCYFSGFWGAAVAPLLFFPAFYYATAPWVLNGAVILGGLAMAYGGWPTALAVRWRLRSAHPYLRQHARQAVRLWRALALVMMGLSVVTAVAVIPACTLVADDYATPLPQFLLSWVTGWLFMEAGLMMALMLPTALIFALRAYNGPQRPSG
jgi:hypothetical protein